MIRLASPDIGDHEIAAVDEVLRSGWLVQGARVARFEQELAALSGAKHCIAVSSGTAALHGMLVALGVGPGDLVAVPAYSWPATANVVEACGAMPVFIDIDENSLSMRADRLEEALGRIVAGSEGGRRLRAVVTVHPFGVLDGIGDVASVCDAFGLPLIEDAACAIGSVYDGRASGGWGLAACLSFHPRKVVTTGEGGAVVTDDADIAHRLRAFRNHGLNPDAPGPQFVSAGLNYRLSEIHAAIGLSQMGRLADILQGRRRQAAFYDGLLAGTPLVPQRYERNRCVPNYQSYVVALPEGAEAMDVVARMRAAGVECSIATWHIPLTGHFRARYGYRQGDFPGADRAFRRALALPMSVTMSERDQQTVVSELLRAISGAAG
jgi:perosamine synthetase